MAAKHGCQKDLFQRVTTAAHSNQHARAFLSPQTTVCLSGSLLLSGCSSQSIGCYHRETRLRSNSDSQWRPEVKIHSERHRFLPDPIPPGCIAMKVIRAGRASDFGESELRREHNICHWTNVSIGLKSKGRERDRVRGKKIVIVNDYNRCRILAPAPYHNDAFKNLKAGATNSCPWLSIPD